MFSALVEGFALGLGTGTACIATCAPIYLPWLMSENKSLYRSLGKLMEISAGRFVSYIAFGALAGYFGSSITPLSRGIFGSLSFILLSIFMLIHALRTQREAKRCHAASWQGLSKSAFLLGIFTGINFCPSFLIALSSAIGIGGVISGMQVFLGFFAGTSLFLLPLALGGYLSYVSVIRKIARYSTLVIAVWFLGKGSYNLYQEYQAYRQRQNSYILDLGNEAFLPIIICSEEVPANVDAISDSLYTIYQQPVNIIPTKTISELGLTNDGENYLLLIEEHLISTPQDKKLVADFHHFSFSTKASPPKVASFIRNNKIRISTGQKLNFYLH